MAKSTCRCKKSAEGEECPEWIFTFAALVMLMMGFFVILWVLKPPAGKKGDGESDAHWVQVEAAIRGAFGHIPDPSSNDPVDIEMMYHNLDRMPKQNAGDGGKINQIERNPEGDQDQVTSIRVGKYATEGTKLTFPTGDATLSADAKDALKEIADNVRGHRHVILIKGHTSLDDFSPDGTADAKMQLSIRRAHAVANFLASVDISQELLRVEGCTTFEPVVQGEY